jgi:hypothetical protein
MVCLYWIPSLNSRHENMSDILICCNTLQALENTQVEEIPNAESLLRRGARLVVPIGPTRLSSSLRRLA